MLAVHTGDADASQQPVDAPGPQLRWRPYQPRRGYDFSYDIAHSTVVGSAWAAVAVLDISCPDGGCGRMTRRK
jgi:hypothetical protein